MTNPSMQKRDICGGKFMVFASTNSIVLPVPLRDLPGEIEIEGATLALKSFFYASLVCINEIARKNTIATPGFADAVVREFCDFAAKHEVRIVKFTNEFRFAAQDDLKTVVAMCEVSGLNQFFDVLNRKYSLRLEYPPTHVTLYTLPGKVGIFLTDSDDLAKFTKKIANPLGRDIEVTRENGLSK